MKTKIKYENKYVGKIVRHTFGYDMTINVYGKIISETEKSVVIAEMTMFVSDDFGMGGGKSSPGKIKEGGKTSRLMIRGEGENVYFKGRDFDNYPRPVMWALWNGGCDYFNTWD